jgi:hypothetical protein
MTDLGIQSREVLQLLLERLEVLPRDLQISQLRSQEVYQK